MSCGYRSFTYTLVFHIALFLGVFYRFKEESLVVSDDAWD